MSEGLVQTELAPTRESAAQRKAYVWYVVALLTVVNVFNYMDRMALSVLMPAIKADLHLSDTQLGLLVGFAFFVFYAVCGIPVARWADRGIRRNIIALALGTWSVMTALSGAAQSFWHLFAARVGVGAGEAGCLPPAQSILCDYFPVRRRPGVFAFHGFGLLAGMMTGMALAGWLGAVVGWRWTFVVLGLPGLALAVIVRLTLREPPRGAFDKATPVRDRGSFARTAATLLRCRTYRWLMAFYVVNGFAQFGFYQWWPSLYTRVFDLSPSLIGVRLGLAIGIGSGIGILAGGSLANKLGERDLKLPLALSAIAAGCAFPAVLGSLFIPAATTSMVAITVAVMLWSVPNGTVAATVCSVTAPNMRATAAAMNIFATSVLGFGLGPFCVGLLSDVLSANSDSSALRYALLAPAAFVPVMAITLYRASRHVPEDMRAAGAVV